MTELPESRLYTFIDDAREFALYFLEGQKLIHDMALLHAIHGGGFAYFRDVILSIQPLIALLKGGEQFGFYIDSDDPLFRLKIESGHQGATRSMLVPESFREFPERMTGMVRLQKLFPGGRPPYQSILQIDALPLRDIVNRVLEESYQVNCAVLVSQSTDQSLMLHQLPPLPGEDPSGHTPQAAKERRGGIRERAEALFAEGHSETPRIRDGFERLGFRLLAHRPVFFHCPCSRERMIQTLRPIHARSKEPLFDPAQEVLEVTCEYCKSQYAISRADLESAGDGMN